VEQAFATMKYRIFEHPRFLLRGLAGAQTETSLATLVYKLKRMLNILGGTKFRSALACYLESAVRTVSSQKAKSISQRGRRPHSISFRNTFKRRPLPLALPHPGSNRRGSSGSLSYSYVNESRGQVATTGLVPKVTVQSLRSCVFRH
jgi:hypothetical protein